MLVAAYPEVAHHFLVEDIAKQVLFGVRYGPWNPSQKTLFLRYIYYLYV